MRRTLAAALTVAALALAGCGESTTDSAESATPNDADLAFAEGMVSHHAQALTMVDLTEGRDLDPEVQALADDIAADQEPEIETLSGWLEAWGEDVPDTDVTVGDLKRMERSARRGGDSGAMSEMPGMLSSQSLRQLKYAPDTAFQDVWLAMMINHHKGAVQMAEAEIADGDVPEAVDLAEQVRDQQTAQIETMKQLIGSGA